jgi:uncharacterized protein
MNHSIRAIALFLAAGSAVGAQQPAAPAPATFAMFIRSTAIGSEQVAVARGSDGWTISSTGRYGPPLDVVIRNLQIRYAPDWKPLELTIDGTSRGQVLGLHILVNGQTVTTHLNNAGQTSDRADSITPDTVLMPNPFFAAYEAVVPRLKTAAVGAVIPVYQGAALPLSLRVGDSETERIQTVSRLIEARHTHAALVTPGAAELPIDLWGDESGRLMRLSVPSQEIEYVRDDVAAVSTRRVVISRPGDESVQVPANGFSLAGTVSRPAAAAAGTRNPAAVLVVGSGPLDRDATVGGIPVFGQLAGALADAGLVVLRYDKRGIGQSGGRVESAGLADYAEDVRAAVKFLDARKDVDPKRIVVIGHSEGGAAALIAASKDNKIDALVLMGTPGYAGTEILLAQQRRALEQLTLTDAEKQSRVDLQKRIHEAVITGKGWDALPPQLRRQVDNPEFQSILTFDPATVMPRVRQPILIVHGTLDTQVEPPNADRLESLARSRKRQAAVETVKIPGVNHLFVAATTGDVSEYPTLKDKQISPLLASSITTWLQKTLPPGR